MKYGRNTRCTRAEMRTRKPKTSLMGMSAVAFLTAAPKGLMNSRRGLKEAGIGVSIGSHSCTSALRAYGRVKRISILSPYYPIANEQVARYFSDLGIKSPRHLPPVQSWTAIAEVPPSILRDKLVELSGKDVDAIVQVGTNRA